MNSISYTLKKLNQLQIANSKCFTPKSEIKLLKAKETKNLESSKKEKLTHQVQESFSKLMFQQLITYQKQWRPEGTGMTY